MGSDETSAQLRLSPAGEGRKKRKPAAADQAAKPVSKRNPKRTSAAILQAAVREFTEKGLDGARVDIIARRAGINKRMLYHYYGDKEALYLAVLEDAYTSIRRDEARLDLKHQTPEDGIRQLTLFTWNYYQDHPEFLSLLGTENLKRARYLKKVEGIRSLHSDMMQELDNVLKAGAAKGVFRRNLDPLHVYLTIAALGFLYLSNRFTLSTIFGRDLEAPENMAKWEDYMIAVVLSSVKA